jgi:hypothetical protein
VPRADEKPLLLEDAQPPSPEDSDSFTYVRRAAHVPSTPDMTSTKKSNIQTAVESRHLTRLSDVNPSRERGACSSQNELISYPIQAGAR